MTAAFEFEFFDELPRKQAQHLPAGMVDAFAAALKERPGVWGRWPGARTPTGYTSAIRDGRLTPFPEGQFETHTRNGLLYVRYLGEEEL